ncbi:HAD-IC family P-type ATPase [Albimonas sp. CAU 1670]|uniref:HAD-IC family P-type ATPase n=1 Tax=Albimonas sp. CAU 1670 TaxID=3032599 RepID=UPI0023DA2A6A|nr:HAD-IC family P-type ATPase [Albimonas sp. CAU 1670]MDF2231831.1 HAD-IC family P-type ATPase [Albimonas sp. CAU 1670]
MHDIAPQTDERSPGPAETPLHALPIEAALAALDAPAGGLSEAEAARRLARHGPNRLPEARGPGPLRRFLAQFQNVLIYVLLASAAVTAALQHWVDAGVILAVVLANAAIGFVQEGRAEQAMAAIRVMLAPRASAIRDGRRRSLDAGELVPGDLVLVEAGDRIPADLRLVEARDLKVEEAILTGESLPVRKSPEPVAPDAPLGDRTSMLFSGTLAATGTGRGVVTATGADTQIGRISGMLSSVEELATPLLRQMDVFARWLTAVILAVAACVLAWGLAAGRLSFGELFMAVVGLSVAAIPEGLPAVLTITLAVGVQAMARRNAIVRRLPAIETLGSVSVICADKTGTLTRNEMAAVAVVSTGGAVEAEGEGYAPEGAIRGDGADPATLEAFARVAALCNDAALHGPEDAAGDGSGDGAEHGWRIEGDPMEGALLTLAARIAGEGPAPFRRWRRTDAIPFDAAHRWMATLDHDHEGRAAIHVKGAPEAVLALCADQRAPDGGSEALDPARWHAEVAAMAAKGQRVIAAAVRAMPPEHVVLDRRDVEGRLTLLGLIGLVDPPRAAAAEAVAECRRAGIRVKMITGDHAATACAIAGRIGLASPDRALTGAEIDAMDDAALAQAVLDVDVFARASPGHKLRLVEAMQARGLTVAMTGDGVNDAPALKRADVGVAMGLKGSAAAREAAEIVLADDDVASIVAAVREGRTAYDNIKKVIGWSLPTSAGEAITIVAALFAGLALPITPVQILWVNLITAVTLGLALAFEPTERGTMSRPPRPRDAPLLTGELLWHVALVSTLFLAAVFGVYAWAIEGGRDPALARTLAMNTLVVLEIFHLFFIRNIHGASLTWAAARGTPVVWACVIAATAAQLALTYAPPLQALFGTRAVPLADGALVLATGVVFFVLIETEKRIRLSLRRRRAGAR